MTVPRCSAPLVIVLTMLPALFVTTLTNVSIIGPVVRSPDRHTVYTLPPIDVTSPPTPVDAVSNLGCQERATVPDRTGNVRENGANLSRRQESRSEEEESGKLHRVDSKEL